MAQTTCLVSFGPVFIGSHYSSPLSLFHLLFVVQIVGSFEFVPTVRKCVSDKKMRQKKNKKNIPLMERVCN